MTEALQPFWAIAAVESAEGPALGGKPFDGQIRVGARLIVPESWGISPFVRTVFAYGKELDFADEGMNSVLVVEGYDISRFLPDKLLYFEDGDATEPSSAAIHQRRIVEWAELTRVDPTEGRRNLLELAADESLSDICARYVGGELAKFAWAGMLADSDSSSWTARARAAFEGATAMTPRDKSVSRDWGELWWSFKSERIDELPVESEHFPEPQAGVRSSDLAALIAYDPTEGRSTLLNKMSTLERDPVGEERGRLLPVLARLYWAGVVEPAVERNWFGRWGEEYRAMIPLGSAGS